MWETFLIGHFHNGLKLDSFDTFKFVCEVATAQSDLCECSDLSDLPFDPGLKGQGNSLPNS